MSDTTPMADAQARLLLRIACDHTRRGLALDGNRRAFLEEDGLDRTALDQAADLLVARGHATLTVATSENGADHVALMPTDAGIQAAGRLRLVRSEAA